MSSRQQYVEVADKLSVASEEFCNLANSVRPVNNFIVPVTENINEASKYFWLIPKLVFNLTYVLLTHVYNWGWRLMAGFLQLLPLA